MRAVGWILFGLLAACPAPPLSFGEQPTDPRLCEGVRFRCTLAGATVLDGWLAVESSSIAGIDVAHFTGKLIDPATPGLECRLMLDE